MAVPDDASADRLRLGYVVFQYPQLSETFISDEIAELVRQGVDVTVFTLEPARPRDPLVAGAGGNVPIVDCSLPASKLRRVLFALRLIPAALGRPVAFARAAAGAVLSFRKVVCVNFLHAAKVFLSLRGKDVRLFHGGFADQPATVAMFAAELCGAPFSFAAHSGRDTRRHTASLGRKVERAVFVRPVSDFIRNSLRERFGHGDKMFTVRCGIAPGAFRAAGDRRGDFEITTVGRLVEEKGIACLLGAAYILKRKGLPVRYRVIGDGPLRNQLLDIRSALALKGDVEFLGARNRAAVVEALRGAAAFILPCVPTPEGNMDGLPIAVLEAMACGVPVVSTNISGIPEAVVEGVGLLVPPGDVEALAAAIGEVYDDWLTGGGRFAAGRRVVKERFSLRKNVAALAGAMRTAAGEPVEAAGDCVSRGWAVGGNDA